MNIFHKAAKKKIHNFLKTVSGEKLLSFLVILNVYEMKICIRGQTLWLATFSWYIAYDFSEYCYKVSVSNATNSNDNLSNSKYIESLQEETISPENPSSCIQHTHTAPLTQWCRSKMDAIFQTTFSNAFSWMKMFKFRLRFHWCLFPRVQLTIFHHWFR